MIPTLVSFKGHVYRGALQSSVQCVKCIEGWLRVYGRAAEYSFYKDRIGYRLVSTGQDLAVAVLAEEKDGKTIASISVVGKGAKWHVVPWIATDIIKCILLTTEPRKEASEYGIRARYRVAWPLDVLKGAEIAVAEARAHVMYSIREALGCSWLVKHDKGLAARCCKYDMCITGLAYHDSDRLWVEYVFEAEPTPIAPNRMLNVMLYITREVEVED